MPLENPSQVYTIVDTWALEFAIKEANIMSVIISLAYHHILALRAVLRKVLKWDTHNVRLSSDDFHLLAAYEI